MSHKLGMLAIMGAAALFGAGAKGMYNFNKEYSSPYMDVAEINKVRRLSRRSKSMRRSRKKR